MFPSEVHSFFSEDPRLESSVLIGSRPKTDSSKNQIASRWIRIKDSHFSKQDWHFDDSGFKEPRHSDWFWAEMCYLYRRTRLKHHQYVILPSLPRIRDLVWLARSQGYPCSDWLSLRFSLRLRLSLAHSQCVSTIYRFLELVVNYPPSDTIPHTHETASRINTINPRKK